ncbi:MAG: terminase large subunit domain-containing protein, partial [Holosporales bacterium]
MTSQLQLAQTVRHKIHQELTRRLRENTSQWLKIARPNQLPPEGEWRVWLVMAGRGFGKTRTGAETIQAWAETGRYRRMALIGATQQDVRAVMVEGESGVMSIRAGESRPHYEPSKSLLTWPNGAKASLLSADRPEGLRGHQFDAAWVDEVCKFRNADQVWKQLNLCLRLGDKPRVIITTT